jgi:hypothetical protein
VNITDLRVADATRILAEADTTDITDPDMVRQDAVALIVRLRETLRTMTGHAATTDVTVEKLRSETAALRTENADLRAELATTRKEVAA